MKLYTEFEVKFAMDIARCQPNLTFDEVLEHLTQIPLPTDEEIVQHSKEEPDNFDIETSSGLGKYVAGAIWLRNKIQGGIK